MNAPVRTRTFKSGNSVAVRLPKGFAIPADSDVVIGRIELENGVYRDRPWH